MPGTIVMIVILVVSPVLILMGSTLLAALLGWAINDEVDNKHEGTELLSIAYPGTTDPE